MEVCSPSSQKTFQKHNSCFDDEALFRIADALNIPHSNKTSKTYRIKLWEAIRAKMHSQCSNQASEEACWIDKIPGLKRNESVADSIRPSRPASWYANPHTWLTNYDIEEVMTQYEQDKSNKFKFIGVFPVDFESNDKFGKCMYSEICSLDVNKYYDEGIKYLGLIINLDRHDEPGSHWTSLFVCIDPHMPCFGAYYYDSVSRKPHKDMHKFMLRIKKEAEAKHAGSKFKLQYNTHKEQYGDSECGMFSMMYQLRWMHALKANPKTTFDQVMKTQYTDDDVFAKRMQLFRPNYQVVAKTGGNKPKQAKA